MWLLREILLTIVVLYTCVETMDIRTFKKDWTTSQRNFGFESIEEVARLDNKFAYGVCKSSSIFKSRECDIKLETLSDSSSSDRTKICHTKFTTEGKRSIILELNLFGNNKVLVAQTNSESKNDEIINLRFSILDMDTCLRNDVMMIVGEDSISKSAVIMYNETFDIIMSDQESCGSTDACRVTFDQWGKQIAGPVSFPLNLTKLYAEKAVHPVQYLSPAQGFYVVWRHPNDKRLLVTRLGFDGTVTRLMTVEYTNFIMHRGSSNNNDSFSTCWSKVPDPKEVHCVQFTARDGYVRINVTLPVVQDTLPLAIYNLPEGLLLVTINSNQDQCNSFEVTKILTNGRKSSFVIDELDLLCDPNYVWAIKADVKDDGKEICFNFVNEKLVFEGEEIIKNMQYRSKCVVKRDIEKL